MTSEEETQKETAASIPSEKIKKTKKKKKSNKKSKKSSEQSVPVPEQETTAPALANDRDDGDCSDSDDEGLFDIAAKWAETKESEEHSKILKPKSESATRTTQKDTPRARARARAQAQANPNITPYNPTGISLTSANAGYQCDRNRSTKSQFSLHITNLPYNATKQDIEQVFSSKGCEITSTRLVFNHHKSRRDEGRNKKNAPKDSNDFTGVAFVDVADEKSYKLGLELDKSTWNAASGGGTKEKEKDTQKGRGYRRMTLNVRPTKTKEELAEIVSKTKEKMMNQKEEYHKVRNERLERQGNEGSSGHADEEKDRDADKKKRKQKDLKDRGGNKRKRDGEDGKMQLKKDNDKKTEAADVSSLPSKKQTSESKKLTKKERAKKAAILMKNRRS